MAKKKHFQKHQGVSLLVLSIPFIIIIFLAILYVFNQRFVEVKEENSILQQQVAQLENENRVYKKAYEILLADVEQLSEMFGAKDRYREVAANVDKAITNSSNTIEESSFTKYIEQGIIDHSCLETINTSQNIILSITKDSPLTEARIDLYLDANKIQTITEDVSEHTLTLEPGIHEISLFSPEGSTDIPEIKINNQTIIGKIDYGKGWNIFNCEETAEGTLIERTGALRILLKT